MAQKNWKKDSGRRDWFRQKSVEIGAILAMFRPFEDFARSRRSSRNMWIAALEELWLFECYHQIRLEKLPRHSEIQLSMIFGGGVNKSISIFFLTFGPKLTCTFLVCWYGDMIIWSYDDMMIWWHDDMMIWWYDDMMIWNTRNVLRGTHGMSCVDHSKCLAWITANVLLGAQQMSCLEHRKCPAWNTGNVLLGTQEMFCLEPREPPNPCTPPPPKKNPHDPGFRPAVEGGL